jgi:carbonic anhydrase
MNNPAILHHQIHKLQINMTASKPPAMLWQSSKSEIRDFLTEQTKDDQHPHSLILSCLDSRIPPEIIFDQGIGNIFVARVAGNVEDPNILGSMEFATKVKGTKLIVVMGHNKCGAVKGAIDHAELGNLTQLVEQIKPAITGDKSDMDLMMDETAKKNVELTISDILKQSPVISDLVNQGSVKIVGAFYDITDGKVSFMD